MDIDREKLKYLLHIQIYDIELLVENVLGDSEQDPQFSAVTATNLIKCYIQVMNELGEALPYSNVEEFFEFNAYTQEEYLTFEEKRKKESEYYRGIPY